MLIIMDFPEKTSLSEGGNLSFYALLSVLQHGMWLKSDIDAYLKQYRLSHGQLSILLSLREAGSQALRCTDIAENLGRSKPTITRMLEKSYRAGLLRRSGGRGDKREKEFSLTGKALKLLGAIGPEYSRRIEALCYGVSDSEKLALIGILGKLATQNRHAFRVKKSAFSYKEKNALMRSLCASGAEGDIDAVLSFLDEEADIPTTKIVDFNLGLVSTPAGIKRIEYHLFHGSRMQRNYCCLFFARRNDWDTVNRAYAAGLVDYRQAYSR
jgi:DNA-binding MarR family transcriptional regulator